MNRVVITGAGTLNPLGRSVPETLYAMRGVRPGLGERDIRPVDLRAGRSGGQCRGRD